MATTVVARNQFGSQRLLVHTPRELCLPTEKRHLDAKKFPRIRVPIDHYQCYDIEEIGPILSTDPPSSVNIKDQFGRDKKVKVGKPYQLCNPTVKNDELELQHPLHHLVCYEIKLPRQPIPFKIRNQFERETLLTRRPVGLCVPSDKFVL